MQQKLKQYTIGTSNLFALANTLIFMRVPFTFIPNNAYQDRNNKSPFGHSIIDLDLDESRLTIEQLRMRVIGKYGKDFNFTILREIG